MLTSPGARADARPGWVGSVCDPRSIATLAKVYSTLRNLRFSEREARGALDELSQFVDEPAPITDQLLRLALEQLGNRPAP